MAARQTSSKMQKTLNDFKQEREIVTQAIAQLKAVLDLLTGGGAKRRGRPKKIVEATPTRRKPGPKPGKKRAAKKTARTVGKKKPGRRGRPPAIR